jgi:hypothetical protein
MTTYNIAINRLDMPARMLKLPIDSRGFPIPKFVGYVNGKPDFRAVDPDFLVRAVRLKLCFLCGEQLGRHMAFVIGPMCSINRISAEPPSHLECARFAVKACPFLTQPKRMRNEYDLPDHENPGGEMIKRNPGVALIWVTESYRIMRDPNGGVLFKVGEPNKLEWYAHGRIATREEIMRSIETGLPILREMAERDGPDAIDELNYQIERGLALVSVGP